ncbi:MAG: 4-alpha-glucanotransferase [Candidatus Omnitrophica bacterium]|nr:4-alpha-glucanotransferase [Candidatus Omnitrophota bacterium]
MNQRASGILLHLTSVSNPYSIGDLGRGAIEFVDFLYESGQRWWQMLPIGPTGQDDSPYQSMSAFGGNPLLVSPDRLVEQGFLDKSDIEFYVPSSNGQVNYLAAQGFRLRLLRKAFENFEKNKNVDRESRLDNFMREEAYWLEDFSLFLAIQEKEGTSDWTQWDQELRARRPEVIIRAQKYFADDMRYHKFVQWQFSVQFKGLKDYCTSKAVKLIGDVPHFVSHQSADVWAHPGLFKLDADGKPTVVAGVPPDYFSKTGQVWGAPVYRWEALGRQNYSWWIQRLRMAFGRFDFNRLDHFIGFDHFYEIPVQAKTAVNGQYQPGPGASFFEAVYKDLGPILLIADDLGVRTPEVVALMDQFQIPGTQVLQFQFGSDLETNFVTSKQHLVNSVVYTATHDNDTTEGWYQHLPSSQRDALQRKLGVNSQGIVWAMIREAFASEANTVIIPAQDLLGLGSGERMNFPGTVKGNWRWRLKDGALSKELTLKLRSITQSSGRL